MQSINHRSRFLPIFHVLSERRYAAILLSSGLAYGVLYMVIVGVVSYVPGLHSTTDSLIPNIRFTSLGISAIPSDNVFFFILYGAVAFLVTSSFLVGLNVALMFYARRVTKTCMMSRSSKSNGLFGLFPAFFTSFSCCGTGPLTLAIGPAAFSSLSLYSQYMAPLTVAVLAAGTYIMSSKISKEGC
jgi:hypothetical protein